MNWIAVIITVVCIFYTILGGLKAVVFTDALQISVMLLAVITIAISGTVFQDGPQEVFKKCDEGGRLIMFNMNPSMYERFTFWSVLIGGLSYWVSFNSVNQTMVQRYMSLPTLKQARISMIYYTIGMFLFVAVCVYCGLLVYAKYMHCDPKLNGEIQKYDQIFVLYVMDTVGKFQGVPGLFIAGIFGAALSSLSVVLNSTAAVILEDIVRSSFHKNLSEKHSSWLVKGIILALGVVALALMQVVHRMGSILVLSTSLTAIAAGTTFGAFTLGMLVPRSTSTGAIVGMIAGGIMSGWISFGTQIVQYMQLVVGHSLGVWIDGCENSTHNSSMVYPVIPDESKVFPLHRIDFQWINPISICTVVVVGTIVSYVIGARNADDVDPELISPVIHRFLSKNAFKNVGTVKDAAEAASILKQAAVDAGNR